MVRVQGIAVALVAVVACQSGSIDEPVTNGDTGAPVVVSTLPASGAVNVPVATLIQVVFNEAIVEASLNLSLRAGSSIIAGSVTYDEGAFTATLAPTADLELQTEYTVTVAAAWPMF